mmetsp:Transcript_1442/g.3168  ORF Transcript_1442/g.3168 Transcript_1442/m.3168 type:complete len:103 (+) Transcript_1442:650-958(+)
MGMDMLILVANTDGTLDCVGKENMVGDPVGSIGDFVWSELGLCVGRLISGGLSVGWFDDCCVGFLIGALDGRLAASSIGFMANILVGASVGREVESSGGFRV